MSENNYIVLKLRIKNRCLTKLQLDENIAAYLENKPLERDSHISICSDDNIEKVVTNYVIAKQILSNLSWQDKLLYKHVCTTWYSAINSLRKEQVHPVDFFVQDLCHIKQSSNISTEPLAVFVFINIANFPKAMECKNISPAICKPPCLSDHLVLDVIHKYTTAPKECFMSVKTSYVSYMPLPNSVTKDNTFMSHQSTAPIGGLYIPCIPNVKYHMINLKDNKTMKQEFYAAIDKIVTDQVIKGILVFVTDKHLLHSVEDIVFLNHVKDVQPDTPYAMGGCICEDTVCDSNDISHMVNSKPLLTVVSDNLISIGVFTIPKDLTQNECNFDMFSLIIDSSEWNKQKIQASVTQFSKQVPQYEHSVCFKLSCVGRDRKHKVELAIFRAAFPNTRVIGCYGNGELGIDHPSKIIPEYSPNAPKRSRGDSGPQFGIIYSYSTVYVYMGWGKITSPASVK